MKVLLRVTLLRVTILEGLPYGRRVPGYKRHCGARHNKGYKIPISNILLVYALGNFVLLELKLILPYKVNESYLFAF